MRPDSLRPGSKIPRPGQPQRLSKRSHKDANAPRIFAAANVGVGVCVCGLLLLLLLLGIASSIFCMATSNFRTRTGWYVSLSLFSPPVSMSRLRF